MSFKEFYTAVVCSGRAATGFAIASANVLKCVNLSTFVSTLIKKTDGEQSLRYAQGSACGSLRSPPPFASLTQSTNDSWWIFTLLNKDTFNRVNIKPLRGLDEFAFS